MAGIVCARGGAGAGWLAAGPRRRGRCAAQPKVFMGYSDVTFLHSVLNAPRPGHLPRPDGGQRLRRRALRRGEPARRRCSARAAVRDGARRHAGPARRRRARAACRAGASRSWPRRRARRGRCRPDPEGTILFLEDVNERPFRIDRAAAAAARRRARFDGVRGDRLRRHEGLLPAAAAPTTRWRTSSSTPSTGLDVPIALGLSSGHTTQSQRHAALRRAGAPHLRRRRARFEVLEASVA